MSEPLPPFTEPPYIYTVYVSTYTRERGLEEHKPQNVRIREGETALLYMSKEGKPSVVVMPEDEVC